MKQVVSLSLFVCLINLSFATSIVDIKPLTSEIIVVHFDEGYVEHAMAGEYARNETVIATPLTTSIATMLSSYVISSEDDTDYNTDQAPTTIYRKTKPTAFANLCEGWSFLPLYGVFGCDNTSLDHADEHWIYLKLPTPLKQNLSYTIEVDPSIVTGNNTFNFTFEETQLFSDAIHVNNIAYSTDADLKYAYVYHWMGDGGKLDLSAYNLNTFRLVDATNDQEVFTGSLTFRKDEFTLETERVDANETPNQNFSSAEVYECDFSAYNVPGNYYLSVDGIGRSVEFAISCNAFRRPFESVMKGIFNNRSGIDLNNPNTERERPAPHNPLQTPGFAGRLKYTTTTVCEAVGEDADPIDTTLYESGIVGDLNASGWYQDAGDWDGYVSHFKIPINLMFLYEHFSDNFIDGQLNIPESGNGHPDVLDEARWLIRFYKRLKDETETKGWTTGGVPGGRIFGDLWGDDFGEGDTVRGSWEDNDRLWIASGEDAVTTFYYAATAAHYQTILDQEGLTDVESIDWEAEAISAYTWAESMYDANDPCHSYEQYWAKNYAAAALYRLTENSTYNTDFISSWSDANQPLTEAFNGYAPYGGYIYSVTTAPRDASVLSDLNTLIESTADRQLINFIDSRSCRWGGNSFFPMLSGHGTTPYVFEGLMGYALLLNTNPTKAADYYKYLHTTADYFLGTNPLSMTWISGLGEKNPSGILHLDSWASGNGEVKEGIVPYGPWRRTGYTNMGPFHHEWPVQYTYPDFDDWPGHERWFEQRSAPLAGEFTIHQNSINAAVLYGALSGVFDCQDISGIANIGLDAQCIDVYPNPSDQYFTIKGLLPDYTIQVLDVSGNIVMNVPNIGSEVSVNTGLLGSGIYFVNVTHPTLSDLCVRKIIKM